MKEKTIHRLKFYIFIFLVFLSLSVFVFYLFYDTTTIETRLVESYCPEVIYTLLIIFSMTTTFPVAAILVPSVFIFSFWFALLYGFLGIIIGACIVFYGSKYLGKDYVVDYVSEEKNRIRLINKLIKKDPFPYLVLLNYVYFFPSNLAHIVAAVTNTRFLKFFIAMATGNFFNFFGISLWFYGLSINNYFYVTISSVLLVLTTLVPLIVYRRYVGEVWLLAFRKGSYKKLMRAENRFG